MKKISMTTVILMGLLLGAQAQTDYYKADNGSNLGLTNSWIGGVIPGVGDRVFFSNNTANRSMGTAVYNHNWIGIVVTNSNYKWTINNGQNRPIRLGTEGIDLANGSIGGDFQMDTEIRLLDDQTWNVAAAERNMTINGVIVDALGNTLGAGPVALTKTGDGSLTLSGNGTNSTFSGGLTINAGSVSVGQDNVLGTGTLTMNDGAAFSVGNKTQTNNVVVAGSVHIDGNGILSGNISGSGSITHQYGTGDGAFNLKLKGDNSGFSGTITNNGVLAADNKNSFGTGTLILNDGSSLAVINATSLTGTNALANNIVLNGISKLGASNTGGNFELAGNISGDGGFEMTVLGGFDVQVTLSGVNSYVGTTDVPDGYLTINGDNSGATGTVTVAALAALGGDGTTGADIVFADGAKFLFSSNATLTANGGTVDLGNLGVADLVGLDGSVEFGTYTLMDGTAPFDFSSVENLGSANAYYLGGGKSAYLLENGGLQLVVAPFSLEVTSELLPGTNGLALSWQSGSSDSYTVETTTDLVFVPWAPVVSNYVGTGGLLSFTGAVSEAKSFFRVVIEE